MYTCVCVFQLNRLGVFHHVLYIFSEKDEAIKRRIEARVTLGKRERKASDVMSSDDSEDDDLDEDYRISEDDEMKAEWKCADDDGQRSYTTRRNAKIQHGNVYFLKKKKKNFHPAAAFYLFSHFIPWFMLPQTTDFRMIPRRLLRSQRNRRR